MVIDILDFIFLHGLGLLASDSKSGDTCSNYSSEPVVITLK